MTWAFFDKYCDEAYAIIDAPDSTKLKKIIDAEKLRQYLNDLSP
jgi:hypothetical protein